MHCQKCGAKIKEGSKFCPKLRNENRRARQEKEIENNDCIFVGAAVSSGRRGNNCGGKFFLTEEKNVSGEEEEKIEEEIEKNTEKQVASEEETETETESSFNDARPFSCQRAWVQEEEGGI